MQHKLENIKDKRFGNLPGKWELKRNRYGYYLGLLARLAVAINKMLLKLYLNPCIIKDKLKSLLEVSISF